MNKFNREARREYWPSEGSTETRGARLQRSIESTREQSRAARLQHNIITCACREERLYSRVGRPKLFVDILPAIACLCLLSCFCFPSVQSLWHIGCPSLIISVSLCSISNSWHYMSESYCKTKTRPLRCVTSP